MNDKTNTESRPMETLHPPRLSNRYDAVTNEKAEGVTYTPKILADFVAEKIVETVADMPAGRALRILDPAIGHGELLCCLLDHLDVPAKTKIEVYGFETDHEAMLVAQERLREGFPEVGVHFQSENFLDFVLEKFGSHEQGGLFSNEVPETYDLIIANPPYVRTQIMGAARAQMLAEQYGLSGRVDLYFAFLLAMSQVLKPHGVAGIIVSNRFMSTKSGAPVRKALLERYNIRHAWDLGDTKLFDAAVLPAVLIAEGRNGKASENPTLCTIYQTKDAATAVADDPIAALVCDGVAKIKDGRHFLVHHGALDRSGKPDAVWRIQSDKVDSWLNNVQDRTWGVFRDIGKIRVGVKTCADKIFIRKDWQDLPEDERPELIRSLTTHHVARRFKALISEYPTKILYPHEVVQGRRKAMDISKYPASRRYLEQHRSILEGRKYVIEAGREWYEVWVPQDPAIWQFPKLVFRDIAKEPTFWIDFDGSVINGDCYWLAAKTPAQEELLWLASAVANSTFIEKFYDLSFNNKLYAGRRRFITQYVKKFPLPDPESDIAMGIIAKAKAAYQVMPSEEANTIMSDLNNLVWIALTGKAEKG